MKRRPLAFLTVPYGSEGEPWLTKYSENDADT